MGVAVRVDREGDHANLLPAGPFDLAHTTAVARAVEGTVARLSGCVSVDIDLAQLDRIDGAGAVLLARFLDQLDAGGHQASVVEGRRPMREKDQQLHSFIELLGHRRALKTRADSIYRPMMLPGATVSNSRTGSVRSGSR